MTNDAIKKMAREYAEGAMSAEDKALVKAQVTDFDKIRELIRIAHIAGASAHAKLLSEKGVEGARRCTIAGRQRDTGTRNGSVFEEAEDVEFDLEDGEEVKFIEALPALHKIEQLEKQLARMTHEHPQTPPPHRCCGRCGYCDRDCLHQDSEEVEKAIQSELDGK